MNHLCGDLTPPPWSGHGLNVDNFRLIFSYPVLLMFNVPEPRLCDFTIRCKGCGENIPAPIQTMPDTWIIADCPLCDEKRRYLPSEISRGNLSRRLNASSFEERRRR